MSTSTDPITTTTTTAAPAAPARGRLRRPWALWGTAAGLLGGVATLGSQPAISDADRGSGPAVVDLLDRGPFYVGAVAGVLAVAALLVYAAGWARLAGREAPGSLAARVVPLGLVAAAAALTVAYGVKGQLAIYLDGGINQDTQAREALYTYFVIDDLAGFFGWWGAVVAAGGLVWLALREGLVARWVGVVSALVVLAPLAMLVLTGLTGFPGLVSPLWLVVTGLAVAFGRPRA